LLIDNCQLLIDSWRVTVIGLAREGTALVNFLAAGGAIVTASDLKEADALGEPLQELRRRWPQEVVRLELGGHPPSILEGADAVFVSPGVPIDAPVVIEAQRRGLLLSAESRLFAQLCPAKLAGITGSSGKTTTTTLLGLMLEAAGRKAWVGGNIGRPLIGQLGEIAPGDWVVMELSSFQLEYFAPLEVSQKAPEKGADLWAALQRGYSPPVAAILNVTPNHLDRHPSMAAYTAAKAHILESQDAAGVALLGYDNEAARGLAGGCRGRVHYFSLQAEVEPGAFLRNGQLLLRREGVERAICRLEEVRLRGRHNLANALAACALADVAGVPPESMAGVIRTFGGVEHRLELVRERQGVRYYNDSIATSPERLVAALHSFTEPLVLLAGGRDKHLPWDEAARLMLEKARCIVLFGEAAPLIAGALRQASPREGKEPFVQQCATLEEAAAAAARCARPGDVVLLSPGGTSFDAFRDFAQRGERFKQLVWDL
jgi:UDP-N-acetylmuramoylalanine--D-glutamate ligase